MLKHTTSKGEKTEVEVVIADSVRSLIITFLKDGKEKKFSEITQGTKKKDHIIYRELNFLIDRGWIIHTGKAFSSRYRLDLKRIDVRGYLTKLVVAFPPDWSIHRIELDPVALHKKSLSDSSIKEIQDKKNEHLTGKIKIYIAAEKIDEFENSFICDGTILTYKDFSLTPEEFTVLTTIINKILKLRSEAYLEHVLKTEVPKLQNKINQLEQETTLYASKVMQEIEKVKEKSYNKPLELIISYTP